MPSSSFPPIAAGVSGGGKPPVGKYLAGELAAGFIEGDALQASGNTSGMPAGMRFGDDACRPWCDRAGEAGVQRTAHGVAVCGLALKRACRNRLRHAMRYARSLCFARGREVFLAHRGPGHCMRQGGLYRQPARLKRNGEVTEIDVGRRAEDIGAAAAVAIAGRDWRGHPAGSNGKDISASGGA